jgi:3-oxoacyl-[acyl-carrier protein] reductase
MFLACVYRFLIQIIHIFVISPLTPNKMLLQQKNAIIYGAGGSVGSAMAMAFASVGANVFLAGRNPEPVQAVAAEIVRLGGRASAASVDAMDEQAVKQHLHLVLEEAGSIDISFNLVDLQVVQNMPLVDMTVADFIRPSAIAMQSHFITATLAGKQMMKQRSGVILSLTATPGGIGYPFTAGFAPACAAMESFYLNLAGELGIYGIRAVNIRSAGSPDSGVFIDAIAAFPDVMKTVLSKMEADTMLKKLPLVADITNTAVFLASDLSRSITGVTVDVTCGTTAGLNYRSAGEDTFTDLANGKI